MKNRRSIWAAGLLTLAALAGGTYALFQKSPTEAAIESILNPATCGANLNFTASGALDATVPTALILSQVQSWGADFERLDYASPDYNALGHLQRRHVDFYYPNPSNYGNRPKGIIIKIHGGGGDVGFASNAGDIPETRYWLDRGFVVADMEYRRGWTNVNFCASDQAPRDVYNATTQEYARQDTAARLSFHDGVMATEFVFLHCANKYGVELDMAMYGTSFGGAMTAYLTCVNQAMQGARGEPLASWLRKVKMRGALIRYGAVAQEDDVACLVPVMLVGGVGDYIVPFDGGPSYHNLSGKPILGVGALYDALAPGAPPARLIGTCNKGHSDGAIEVSELFGSWLTLMRNYWSGSESTDSEEYRVQSGKGWLQADPCRQSWEHIRQVMIDQGLITL